MGEQENPASKSDPEIRGSSKEADALAFILVDALQEWGRNRAPQAGDKLRLNLVLQNRLPVTSNLGKGENTIAIDWDSLEVNDRRIQAEPQRRRPFPSVAG